MPCDCAPSPHPPTTHAGRPPAHTQPIPQEDIYIWAAVINGVCDQLLDLLATHGADRIAPAEAHVHFRPLALTDREAALTVESFRVLSLIIDATSNRHFAEFRCSDLLYAFLACERMDALEATVTLLAGLGRHRRTADLEAEDRLVARLGAICQNGSMAGDELNLRQISTEPLDALCKNFQYVGHLFFEFYLTKDHINDASQATRRRKEAGEAAAPAADADADAERAEAATNAAIAAAEPGVVSISLPGMLSDKRPVAVVLRELVLEYAVPPEFQYDLGVAIVACQAIGDLPLRQSGVTASCMAWLSADSQSAAVSGCCPRGPRLSRRMLDCTTACDCFQARKCSVCTRVR